MLVTFLFLALLSFGAGFATHKHLLLRQFHSRPEPPVLDTPEHVLSYLEACTLENNPEMNELFSEFRVFVNKQQLLLGVSAVEGERPSWYHNPEVDPSCREHWEVFLTDLERETDARARVEVVRHWMTDLNNNFTFKEIEMILDRFDDSKDRAAVRKIFAGKKAAAKKQKAKKKKATNE